MQMDAVVVRREKKEKKGGEEKRCWSFPVMLRQERAKGNDVTAGQNCVSVRDNSNVMICVSPTLDKGIY